MDTCSLDTWHLDARQEPTIRVGIVLPADGMRETQLVIPDHFYRIWLDDRQGPLIQSTQLTATLKNKQIVLQNGKLSMNAANAISLIPENELPIETQSGIKVHNVISGRGFHWQKKISPYFVGTLEFRVHDGSLLLVNHVPIETYLAGVVTSEMSGACPAEFLKSQIIVARSWVLARSMDKHPNLPIDYCNDDDCQRYQGTTNLTKNAIEAVNTTRGQVLVDTDRNIIDANYAKSCGGISETPENVWFVSKAGLSAIVDAPADSKAKQFLPINDANLDEYLTGDWLKSTDIFCSPKVVSPKQYLRYLGKVDEPEHYFRWEMHYTRQKLEHILHDKFLSRQKDTKLRELATLLDLRVIRRGASGRAIELEIEYRDAAGNMQSVTIPNQHKIREALHEKFLYSSAFTIQIKRDEKNVPQHITFTGAGWGHGVGMCQIGALGMALKGYDCEEIVRHYFKGLDVLTCY